MEALNKRAIEATAKFLERKGCEVIDREWAGPEGIGSIDLVAIDEGELVFVDVAMMVMDDNRALLRRHVNCLGTMEPAI